MSDSTGAPGERRLPRPPSERYRAPEPPSTAGDGGPASPGRGVVLGALAAVALALALALTVAGGVLLVTAGLIAVAAIGGWVVAIAVRSGARGSVVPGRRIGTAVALAVAGVVLGQAGLWAYGQLEGGALGPIEFLAEVYGFLVPLELAAAAAVAWIGAR